MKLYYYKTEPNFGDLLNPLIVEALRGKTPRYARPSHCDSVFIGSLLHLFLDRFSSSSFHFFMRRYLRPTVNVWGTGLVNREAESITNKAGEVAPFCRKMKFYALRGKLTQAFVKEMGYDVDRVTLGDPGLLVARLLKPKPCDEAFSCAIIPHYTELIDLNRFEEYNRLAKKIPGSIIIDVRRPPLETLSRLAASRTILSTAMHGLIVADSLNIPNIRYLPKQPLGGTDFKFKDYYSVFEKERNAPFSAEMLDDVGDIPAFIHDTYNVAKEEVDIICENLLNVFPYRKRELR